GTTPGGQFRRTGPVGRAGFVRLLGRVRRSGGRRGGGGRGRGAGFAGRADEVGQVHVLALRVGDLGHLEDLGQRLAAANLADHHRDLAGAVEHLRELVRVHAVLAGGLHDVVDELGLLDADLFLLGDLIEDDLVLEGALGVGLDLGAVLLGVVLLAGVSAALGEVLLDLLGDHGFGNRNGDQLGQLVHDLVAGLDALLDDLGVGGLLGQVLAQFGDGVELGGQLGEIVVGDGEFALLDGLDDDLHLGGLAGVVAAGQLRLEGGVLVGRQAGDGLVEALEHGAGADLVGQVGSGVDLGAVDGRGQVEGDEVVLGDGALDDLQGAETAAQLVQGGVDVGVGGLHGVDLDLEPGVFRQFDLRTDVDLDIEHEVAVGGRRLGDIGDVDLGAGERNDLTLAHGGLVEVVQAVVDGGLEDVAAADALVDQAVRDLALAE